jgi:hypothetical protein
MNMQKAILVTKLVYEEVPVLSGGDYVEYIVRGGNPGYASIVNYDAVLLTEKVYCNVVPVNEVCFADGRPRLYVAYSEEVERLLGVPVRAISTRAQVAESLAADNATKFNILLDTARELVNLGWVDRLRFLFGAYRIKCQPPRGVRL